jgi:hypothetical protein
MPANLINNYTKNDWLLYEHITSERANSGTAMLTLDNIVSCRAILRNFDCWYSTQGKPFSQIALWSMNQLQDVKPMVHSWKSSCCPTYKVVMVTSMNRLHLSYTQGTIYPETYCHHHKVSWRIHLKNLISLLKKVIPCLNFCNYCWCLSYRVWGYLIWSSFKWNLFWSCRWHCV